MFVSPDAKAPLSAVKRQVEDRVLPVRSLRKTRHIVLKVRARCSPVVKARDPGVVLEELENGLDRLRVP